MGPQADFFVRWRHVRSPRLKAGHAGKDAFFISSLPGP